MIPSVDFDAACLDANVPLSHAHTRDHAAPCSGDRRWFVTSICIREVYKGGYYCSFDVREDDTNKTRAITKQIRMDVTAKRMSIVGAETRHWILIKGDSYDMRWWLA